MILDLIYFTFIYFIELYGVIFITQYLNKFLDNNIPNFTNITPSHKKWYVSNNLVKSIIFSFMSYHSYYLLINYIIHDKWDKYEFLYLGCLYASIDMSSILLVPKLSKNTYYHHMVVNILFLYSLLNGMNCDSFSRLIVIYALFSVLAFSVNFYLAIRILTNNKSVLELFSSFCFINYILCCIPNWSFQFYNLYFNEQYMKIYGMGPIILFGLIMLVVVYDDLVLMKYLKDHSYFKNFLEDGMLNIDKLKIKN